MRTLAARGWSSTSVERETDRDVKEQLCYVVLAHVTALVLSVESSDKEHTYLFPRGNLITVSAGRARVFPIVEETVECLISFHRSVFSGATLGKSSPFPCYIARVFTPTRLQHKVEQSVHVLMPQIVEETVNFFSSFQRSVFHCKSWRCASAGLRRFTDMELLT